MDIDCIIIGCGAAGLMAADHLVQAGKRVIILEARAHIGGRIYTLTTDNFSQPVEISAEFIHGDPPISLALFKTARMSCTEMTGEGYELENGKLRKSDFFQDD
jgi:monoamine oxidase